MATAAPRFDLDVGTRPERFFRRFLVHTIGEWAGQPFVLEAWQHDLMRELFGTLRADGLRQYRTCYLEVPKKNGKSALASALSLYLTFSDREPGAEVYAAAADRFQARRVFDVAKHMVEASPVLSRRCRIYRDAIETAKGSIYRVLSADVRQKHGLNAHGVIFDELHAQPNRELWDVLTGGSGLARRQPLTFCITTAGDEDRESIYWEQHQLALGVLDPKSAIEDPTLLARVYAADPKKWKDREQWKLANPNWGVSCKPDGLEVEFTKAINGGPAVANNFKRLHLGIITSKTVAAIEPERWDALEGAVKLKDLKGRRCFGGLDLASTLDIAAAVFYFPPALQKCGEADCEEWSYMRFCLEHDRPYKAKKSERAKVYCRFWCPEDTIALRSERDKVTYNAWAETGHLIATPGDVLDYRYIRKELRALSKVVQIEEIGYDRWNADQLVTQLQGDGFTMTPVGMGFQSMKAPCKELLERQLVGRLFDHGAHPVLRWMALNLHMASDPAGNNKPDRKKSTDKIDGMVAFLMGLSRYQVAPIPRPSRYERGGIATLGSAE